MLWKGNQLSTSSRQQPTSIAIAGAWGYIGRKLLDAASDLDIAAFVHDPGPLPPDVPADRYSRIEDANVFYHLGVDMYHLALHPEHRRCGMGILLQRSPTERFLILNEKPMATPENPDDCRSVIRDTKAANAVVLYDFPELFDQMTQQILAYLNRFERVQIESMSFVRSKDRESQANPRNYKRMVPIEYQESVHCLAFALYLLGQQAGELETVFQRGLRANAVSGPYQPPNPEIYPYVVDGRCEYTIDVGGVYIEGLTDFTSGASWSKRRVLRGRADGKPFTIEAEYLEDHKQLVINGVDQACDPVASSYSQIILTAWHWFQSVPGDQLINGIFPNPHLAHVTYQLSSVLWHSAHEQCAVSVNSLHELLEFDAGFARRVAGFPRYA